MCTPDTITLRSSDAVPLATRCGPVDLYRKPPGVGGFHDARRQSSLVRVFGADVAVLELAALARIREASGTRGDAARLPVLETLIALPALDARRREFASNRSGWTSN
jgi:hypothetical protein